MTRFQRFMWRIVQWLECSAVLGLERRPATMLADLWRVLRGRYGRLP